MGHEKNKGGCFVLPLDVYDVYGHKIVEAGEEITPGIMTEIGNCGKFATTCRLSLKDSRVRNDMEAALRSAPYAGMYRDARLTEVLGMFDELRILPVLFEEFELMRNRDAYVYEHALKTAALTTSMAIDLFGKDKAPLLGYTALTYDIGMTRQSDAVLKQDVGLDKDMRAALYSHTVIGFILLTYYMGSVQFGNCRVALEHHERNNGVGYPRGIKLNDKLIEIIAVADVFDALMSVRPFRRQPYELRVALNLLWNESKMGVLSPDVVKLLTSYSRGLPGMEDDDGISDEDLFMPLVVDRYIDWKDFQPPECASRSPEKGE